MADIFVSYARADKARVTPLVAALEAQGWSVWWDRQIVGGSHFDKATEDAIAAAKVVVVLWSHASVASHWVRAEAAWALVLTALRPPFIGQRRRDRLDGIGRDAGPMFVEYARREGWGDDDIMELARALLAGLGY